MMLAELLRAFVVQIFKALQVIQRQGCSLTVNDNMKAIHV